MRKVDENTEGVKIEETLFSLNFASKGLEWAENVLQKLENVNLEDIIPKNPSKYVDAVGDHIRKVCEDVADDWLNSFTDGCLKVPVSDLSLEHEVISEICLKSKLDLKECLVIEKAASHTASETGSFPEPNGHLTLGICSQAKSESCNSAQVPKCGCLEEAYDTSQENGVLAAATSFGHNSNGDQEIDPEDNSGSEVRHASISSSASFIDSFYHPGLAENRVSDSFYQSDVTENRLREQGSLASSSHENAWDDPDKQVTYTPPDVQDTFDAVKAYDVITERLEGNDDDKADFLMIDVPVDMDSKETKDAALGESWANLELDNLALVADRSRQSSSFRRRFRNAFRSRKDVKMMKESLEAQTWCKIKHPNLAREKRIGNTKTAASKENLTTVSNVTKEKCEPEWEVL